MNRNLVVIGTSAGGIDALKLIAAALPERFPAAVCAVLHTAPDSPGIVDQILARAGRLPAVVVHGSRRLESGHFYLPPPDHHLVVEPSRVRATRGPKENRFRPAVDPLFRSAAQTYGPRAIGVILTGGMDDGTAGLWAIKQLGGIAIVQDPNEALADSMPRNALRAVDVDHCVPLAEIPALLVRLTSANIEAQGGYTVPKQVQMEVDIARERAPLEAGIERYTEPSKYACPECHGVLRQISEGGRSRYRCHVGHAYSSEALIAELDVASDEALWRAVRALQEKALFIRQLADSARNGRDEARAQSLQRHAGHAQSSAEAVRNVALREDPVATNQPAERGPTAGTSALG